MRPLAIDLFCGLRKPEFGCREDALIEQAVACRTKNPEHVRATVLHLSPYSASAMFGAMRQFNDSVFAARLTRSGQLRKLPSDSRDDTRVLELTAGVVGLLRRWVAAMKRSALFSGCLLRACVGAIPAIAVRPLDGEVLRANTARLSILRFVRLLQSPQSTCPRRASDRTESFVCAFCSETSAAA